MLTATREAAIPALATASSDEPTATAVPQNPPQEACHFPGSLSEPASSTRSSPRCPTDASTACHSRPTEKLAGTERTCAAAFGDIVGECHTKLIPEYGVIHLKNALNDQGQQQLWDLMKPHVCDPSKKATGFHMFTICAKDHKNRKPAKRVPKVDAFGKLIFTLCADALSTTLNVDTTDEPSYQRLLDLATGSKPFNPGEVHGLYYRHDARLFNHTDSHEILFTMTLAIGDDCDFHIGKAYRKTWLSERNGVVKKIRMKSGDAVFFDGGSVPHEVVRIRKGTGPSWWNDAKVPNGSRFVFVFREQEQGFYQNKIKNDKKKKKMEGKAKKLKARRR